MTDNLNLHITNSMGNQRTPQKNEQSIGSEDSMPTLSQIKYELSDSATAKPAAPKPSGHGAYNASYNAPKHAAKVVSQEQFSLLDVRLEPRHHKELKDRMLPMFFSTMGDTSGLYNQAEAAQVVHSSPEDIPIYDSIGLEQFHVSKYHCV